MPEFVLDQSGYPPGIPGGHDWRELDGFTQGYIEAMFFTEQDHDHDMADYAKGQAAYSEAFDDARQGEIPNDAGFRHLSATALEAILADCQKFQAGDAWQETQNYPSYELERLDLPDDTRGGHDFWLTRNGHGAGFWDGDWPEPHGTALTEASKAFGEVDVYWVPTPYDRDADAGDWEATGEVCL